MKKIISHNHANPYLPLWEHLPDGEPRVFEDPDNPGSYRIYIIGSHDVRLNSYCGPDIRAWSAPVDDLNNWRDEGSIFTYEIGGEWDVMYAPDLVEVKRKNGEKEYYLYPHSRGPHREAMVCKGKSPVGPFTPINLTEDGQRTVPGSILGFDPAVFVEYITDPKDKDYEIGFRAYGYWGFQKSHAVELDQNTMYSARPGAEVIHHFIPASRFYGVTRDPQGTTYPYVFPGEDLKGFNFFEAASIRKVGNKYVWVYSGFSGPDYGLPSTNSALRYAYGDTLFGPWKSGGVLVDSRAPVVNRDGEALELSYAGHNTHGSIEEIGGRWYCFYHRAPRGFGNARQPMVAPINVEWDEKSVADGGKVKISAHDPQNKKWSAKAGGHEYTGAEVTSEGFNIFGLNPYKYYSAGIACYLSNHGLQADSWNIWDDHMPVTGLTNGSIVGYKYFGFGGLEKETAGLKPYVGAKPGNKTKFNLYVLPRTSEGFKLCIWLDGPVTGNVWNGTKIGEIAIPSGSVKEITHFAVDVSSHVEGLTGKHAIFLSAEGNNNTLCDIIGLGFSGEGHEISRPIAPCVEIEVDGVKLEIPPHPVRSTVKNGICDYELYEVQANMTKDKAALVKASANSPQVTHAVYNTEEGCTVKFTYKGVTKTYKLL